MALVAAIHWGLSGNAVAQYVAIAPGGGDTPQDEWFQNEGLHELHRQLALKEMAVMLPQIVYNKLTQAGIKHGDQCKGIDCAPFIFEFDTTPQLDGVVTVNQTRVGDRLIEITLHARLRDGRREFSSQGVGDGMERAVKEAFQVISQRLRFDDLRSTKDAKTRTGDRRGSGRPLIHTVGPIVLGVAGAASMGLGIYGFATGDERCGQRANDGTCTSVERPRTTLSAVYLGAGIAAVTGAVLWFVLADRGGERSSDQSQGPAINLAVHPQGITLLGSF